MDSKITTKVSPPAEVYHDLKVIDTMSGDKELLPPIYAIHTMDVFRDPNYVKQPQDGSYMAAFNLFQPGRPLWGSRCKAASGDNISNVVDDLIFLAKSKNDGSTAAKRLESMSYRLQLSVVDNQVAEQMVQSGLRYILYINPSRDSMQTIHPSEPLLAYASQAKMMDPEN